MKPRAFSLLVVATLSCAPRVPPPGTQADDACSTGHADACLKLSRVWDPERSAAYLKRACELKSVEACVGLGERYVWGLGVETAPDRALELFASQCAVGNESACAAEAQLSNVVQRLASTCGRTRTGELDHGDVASIARLQRGALTYCYEAALAKNASLKGSLVVRFDVAPHGFVDAVELAEDSLANAEVSACVVARVKRWRFPCFAGDEAITVEYPFSFSPAAGEGR